MNQEIEFIFADCEYLTKDGARERRWRGLDDPPPVVVQAYARKVAVPSSGEGIVEGEEFSRLVIPRDAGGSRIPLPAFFTELTTITEKQIDAEGVELEDFIWDFWNFCLLSHIVFYGPDDLATLSPSFYMRDAAFPFVFSRFRDFRRWLRDAGIDEDVINSHSSGTLYRYFNLKLDEGHVHEASHDAHSMVACFKHLVKNGADGASLTDRKYMTYG